ncbi:YceI family protein [Candidatus Woesearchaeota archaeon]|nr:MAG: YceI family protein [Candidatus Woesearchaeota archaeon]
MNTKTLIAIAAILSLFLIACQPREQTPSQEIPEKTGQEQSVTPQPIETENEPTTSFVADGTYTLDPTQSTLSYSAARITGSSHTGTVALSFGEFTLAGETAHGTFTIDMTQITESKNNTRFLTHLASEDFFAVAQHPTSTFTITEAEKTNTAEYLITGNLTIIGNTKEITFPAQLSLENNSLLARANFTIDRTRWNITYDSGSIFSEIGDRAIKDNIGYALDLVFTKN